MKKPATNKIAYFDCSSGISGDMCLGALTDLGVPLARLKRELKKIPIDGYTLKASEVIRSGQRATKVDVKISGKGKQARKWKHIQSLIKKSTLGPEIKKQGLEIFKRIFEAEAAVHGETFESVHLHELASTDAVVDVMGSLILIDALGIKKIISSPLNLGSGSARSSHGTLPVPAPAAVELLAGVPVYSSGPPFELTTPTGAALMSTLAFSFGKLPPMELLQTGTGAGNKDFTDRPNVLRVFLGIETVFTGVETKHSEDVYVVETNVDDMDPRIWGYVTKKLLKQGGLDVYLTQVIMKKGRPGVKLTVLCAHKDMQALTETIFKETTTIGVRYYPVQRRVLERHIRKVQTEYGPIRVKDSVLDGGEIKSTPEYKDCKSAAKKHQVPIAKIITSAAQKAQSARKPALKKEK